MRGKDEAGANAIKHPQPALTEEAQVFYKEGARLTRIYCMNCHGQAGRTAETMLAPALSEVRRTYLKQYPDEAAFVAAMLVFLEKPKRETTLMPEAVERYGLKAPVMLDEAALKAASAAVYIGAF